MKLLRNLPFYIVFVSLWLKRKQCKLVTLKAEPGNYAPGIWSYIRGMPETFPLVHVRNMHLDHGGLDAPDRIANSDRSMGIGSSI